MSGICYVDIDGVLGDMQGALIQRYNKRNGTNWHPSDITGDDFAPVIQGSDRWWNYTNDYNFWRNISLFPWSKDLLVAVMCSFRNYAFLSSIPTDPPDALHARRAWLDEHFIGHGFSSSEHLIGAKHKELVVHAGDVLIDDMAEHINAVQAVGATVITLAQPWNKGLPNRMDAQTLIEALRKGDLL
jgi:5'(3')-deoxyribonucleotidase